MVCYSSHGSRTEDADAENRTETAILNTWSLSSLSPLNMAIDIDISLSLASTRSKPSTSVVPVSLECDKERIAM